MTNTFLVTATVDDAISFEEQFADAPEGIALGYERLRVKDEEIVEFYLLVDSEDEALAQFQEACEYVGQEASEVEVEAVTATVSNDVGF